MFAIALTRLKFSQPGHRYTRKFVGKKIRGQRLMLKYSRPILSLFEISNLLQLCTTSYKALGSFFFRKKYYGENSRTKIIAIHLSDEQFWHFRWGVRPLGERERPNLRVQLRYFLGHFIWSVCEYKRNLPEVSDSLIYEEKKTKKYLDTSFERTALIDKMCTTNLYQLRRAEER